MRRWLAAALLAVLGLLALPGTAAAHNVLESSDPADGSTMDGAPRAVTLRFNDDVQQGPNTITVTGPDGKQWQSNKGDAEIDGDTASNALRELGPAGKYTIGYRIISADGHPLNGKLTFTLAKQGNGTPNPAAAVQQSAPAQQQGGGVPVWVWIGGAVVLLGVGTTIALRAGRQS